LTSLDSFYTNKKIKGPNVLSSESDKTPSIDDDATYVEADNNTTEQVEIPRNIGLFGGIAFIVGSIIGKQFKPDIMCRNTYIVS